jgi:hypothetical protein
VLQAAVLSYAVMMPILLLLLLLLLLQVKELLQANKPVRDAEWTAKEVSSCV